MSKQNKVSNKSDISLDPVALDQLIEALQVAKQVGFAALGSSSATILLNGMIDLSLLTSKVLRSEPKKVKLNPSLKETDDFDSLGNQKIVKIDEFSTDVRNPQAAKFLFNQLIPFLISIKQGKTLDESYDLLAKKTSKFYSSDSEDKKSELPGKIDREICLVSPLQECRDAKKMSRDTQIGLEIRSPRGSSFSLQGKNRYYSTTNLRDSSSALLARMKAENWYHPIDLLKVDEDENQNQQFLRKFRQTPQVSEEKDDISQTK